MFAKKPLVTYAAAFDYACRLLGGQARSVQELHGRLRRRDTPAEIIAQVETELTRLGYLDDAEYARAWVASHPGWGPTRWRQGLRTKGITESLAEDAIATGLSTRDELSAAWQVAQKAVRTRSLPLDASDLLRVRRLLLRRGYAYAVIAQVCAQLAAQSAVEGEWLD
jgi:regulatory protein